MGCNCNKNKKNINQSSINNTPISNNPIQNLVKASTEQKDKIRWFKDGLTGLVKCITNQFKYSDKDIISNREICSKCEFATKKSENGKLTKQSQCMAIDPKTNAPCGCFLLCKTQVGDCPLNKWVSLTKSV